MIIAFKNNNNRGFTLIELLITLAVAGILFSIAVPSLSKTVSNTHQTSVLHTLFTHLNLARTQAILEKQHILLCKSIDGVQCITQSAWSDGWLIFADTDNNKIVNGDEQVIHVQQALPGTIYLNYRGFGSNDYFRYFSDGHSSANGTFTLCSDSDETLAQSIIVSRTGRVRMDNKTGSGKPLVCS